MSRKLLFFTLLIFFFFSFLYSYLALPGVFGADSGEFLAVMKVLGVAHPPGYPLYTMLGHLFLKLPFGEPAFRVGLFSALASSLALVFIFFALHAITKSVWISFLTTFILGFSYTFWLYAEVVEVFSLNALFASILIFLAIKILLSRRLSNRLIFITALIFGLALSHHHTILLLTPSFLYLYFLKRRLLNVKVLFKSLAFLIAGFLPYLYLPLAARRLPPLNWGNPSSLENFWTVVLRSGYGTFQSITGNFPNMPERIMQLPIYGVFLLLDFSPFFLLFFLLGVILLFRDNRKLFNFLFLGFLFTGPLFFFYASFPVENNLIVGILERFFILSTLFVIFFIAYGLYEVTFLIEKMFQRIFSKKFSFKASRVLIFVSVTVVIIFQFRQNINRLDFRNVYVGNEFAYDILRPAERGSIVFMAGDLPLFTSEYVYFVLGYRPDIKLIPLTRIREFYVIQKLHKLYPELALPQSASEVTDITLDIIKKNEKTLPIYSIYPLPIGQWYPAGFLYRYIPEGKTVEPAASKKEILYALNSFSNVGKISPRLRENLFFSEIVEAYGAVYLSNVSFLISKGFFEEAKVYLDYVKSIQPSSLAVKKNLFRAYASYFFKERQCQEAEEHTLSFIDLVKNSPEELKQGYGFLIAVAQECFHDEEKAMFYEKLTVSGSRIDEKPLNKL